MNKGRPVRKFNPLRSVMPRYIGELWDSSGSHLSAVFMFIEANSDFGHYSRTHHALSAISLELAVFD